MITEVVEVPDNQVWAYNAISYMSSCFMSVSDYIY